MASSPQIQAKPTPELYDRRGSTPGAGALELEDGGALLLEDDSALLLE